MNENKKKERRKEEMRKMQMYYCENVIKNEFDDNRNWHLFSTSDQAFYKKGNVRLRECISYQNLLTECQQG